MKSIILSKLSFILIFSVLAGCTMRKKHVEHYLSPGVENMKLFPSNKLDSLKINTFYTNVCNPEIWANFKNGMHNFRIELFKNFKLPKNSKEGENRVRVIIGTHDKIEKIEILKYTDEKTREAIEHVFRLKELNVWTSAKIYGIPINEQFEISIFIEKK